MVIGASSSRRPRSSVGQTQDFFSEGPIQQTFDVEFRRKHSRQNKEIITENVRHKTAMKVLNDEIGSLKEEIMEVKQINRILSLQMKKMKEDQKKSCSPATVQAIDALIAAMPALHVLRQSLIPTASPLPVFEAEVSRRNILRNIGMTVGTRPANQGGNLLDLDILGEDEEEEEEEEEEVTYHPRKSLSIRTPSQPSPLSMANSRAVNVKYQIPQKHLNITSPKGSSGSPVSKGMPRSPLPRAQQDTIDMSVESPLSSASSTPVKTASTTPKKKNRRRRESGLIPPVPSVNEELPSTPVSAAVSASLAAKNEAIHEPVGQPSSEAGRYQNGSQNTLGESVGSTSTVSTAPTSFSDMSYVDDDGKRGRRSRMSVNYKEPSLTKKMRKPDGVAIAEALGRRQSTNENVDGILRHTIGVRRKSVLPNSIARLSETRSDGESDTGDVDDIDACLGLEATARIRQKSPDSSTSGSTLTDVPSMLSNSSSSRDTIERIPTPIPPMHADPHPTEEHTGSVSRPITQTPDHPEAAAHQPASPIRTSSRKASSMGTTQSTRNKTRRSSVLPVKTSARVAAVPAGRNRMALADVPEPNAKAKPVVGVMEGTVKPRTGATARR